MGKKNFPVLNRLTDNLNSHIRYTNTNHRYSEEIDPEKEDRFTNIFVNPYFISLAIIFVLLLTARPSFIIEKKTNTIKPLSLTGYTLVLGIITAVVMGLFLRI